jgi:hypothetical protein
MLGYCEKVPHVGENFEREVNRSLRLINIGGVPDFLSTSPGVTAAIKKAPEKVIDG